MEAIPGFISNSGFLAPTRIKGMQRATNINFWSLKEAEGTA